MLISCRWLREYVDFDLTPEELAAALTMAGVAVETIEPFGAGVSGVVAGRLAEVTPHPDSDHLRICKVEVGAGAPVLIVTGATNVAAGQYVPVALPGAVLSGGDTIGVAEFRGIKSDGMLCSAVELGISDRESEGIMILPEPIAPGTDLSDLLGLQDAVLDLDLTANRSDCLSYTGVAREVAAILQAPLHLPAIEVPEAGERAEDLAGVVVLDPVYCSRYMARVFLDVKVGPSPLWIQQRLRAAGVRPISNIVDVTNYVMLEMNQPLHAFDYDQLVDHRIVVKRAMPGEVFVTLDDVERRLEPTDLVIADGGRTVALAGVMGGANTEVTANTKRVLLESACFNPTAVRRTSKRLALRSEASLRMEKGLDPALAEAAVDRAAQLMVSIGAAKAAAGRIDVYPVPVPVKKILLRPSRVNALLGTSLAAEKIKDLVLRLPGLGLVETDQGFEVTPPGYRQDIVQEVDLVEEVARLHGYNNIAATLPERISDDVSLSAAEIFNTQARDLLLSCGLTEVVTYSLVSQRTLDKWLEPTESAVRQTVKLMVPLTEEQAEMRTRILPSLAEVAERNVNRKQGDIRIFEISRVFRPVEGQVLPQEPVHAAGFLTGTIEGGEWCRQAREVDFYDAKGILDALLDRMGFGSHVWESGEAPGFHPGRTARVVVQGTAIGLVGEVHPRVAAAYNLPGRAYAFEIDLTLLAGIQRGVVSYRPLPRFPAVARDLAIIVDQSVPVAQILDLAREAGGELVEEVRLFDVYAGKPIPEGRKNLAFSVVYRAPDRTLTDAEVSTVHERIAARFVAATGGELRR